jgi:hypothetical protein
MGAILACRQCGVRFLVQRSLSGEVSCPHCGAVAVESVPRAGGWRSSWSPIQGLYPRVICTLCRAKLVPPWPVPGGQPIQCRRCNTIFEAPGAFYGYAVEFQYRALPEGEEDDPDAGWEKISADQVIDWQTPDPQGPRAEPAPDRGGYEGVSQAWEWAAAPDNWSAPKGLFRTRRDRQQRNEAFWIALTLAGVCLAGLIGIIVLIALARPRLAPTAPAPPRKATSEKREDAPKIHLAKGRFSERI